MAVKSSCDNCGQEIGEGALAWRAYPALAIRGHLVGTIEEAPSFLPRPIGEPVNICTLCLPTTPHPLSAPLPNLAQEA